MTDLSQETTPATTANFWRLSATRRWLGSAAILALGLVAGGYLIGLNHEDAARFSFLTATPIILAATALELPKLARAHDSFSGLALLSGVVAGAAALGSIMVLMRWFRQHEVKGFDPFAGYCILAGGGAIVWLNLVH